MENFAFIAQTGVSSGKVASPTARKTIRTHVMRKHWTSKASSGVRLANVPSLQSERPNRPNRARMVDRTDGAREDYASGKIASNDGLDLSQESQSVAEGGTRDVGSPCRLLNRATDAFVYAGSSIDLKSYGFFNHYASEFHVILCSEIQPLPLAKTSLCCSTAVQENSPALLHAICFTAAAHEAAARGEVSDPMEILQHPPNIFSAHHEALRHKDVSLRLLSEIVTLETPAITEATILCVTLLLTAEAVLGESMALTAHSTGLRHMVELFGGEDVLSPAVSTHVQLADLKRAQVQQTRPSFKLRPYIQGRFDDLSSHTFHAEEGLLSVLGSRFLSRPFSAQISPAVHKCLRYARRLILVVERSRPVRTGLETYSINDFMALEHSVTSLPYQYSLGEMDECVRTSLLLYSNIAIWRTPLYFAWVVSLVTKLRAALLALNWQTVAQEHAEPLFWMLLMGRHAVSVGHGEDEIMWWSTMLERIVLSLRLWKWEEAEKILEGFFYVKSVCGRSWEAVWKTVVDGNPGDEEMKRRATKHPCDYCP